MVWMVLLFPLIPVTLHLLSCSKLHFTICVPFSSSTRHDITIFSTVFSTVLNILCGLIFHILIIVQCCFLFSLFGVEKWNILTILFKIKVSFLYHNWQTLDLPACFNLLSLTLNILLYKESFILVLLDGKLIDSLWYKHLFTVMPFGCARLVLLHNMWYSKIYVLIHNQINNQLVLPIAVFVVVVLKQNKYINKIQLLFIHFTSLQID